MTEPNWAGGWRPVGFRPYQPPTHWPGPAAPRQRSSRQGPSGTPRDRRPARKSAPGWQRKAALRTLRVLVDGLAKAALLLARLSVRLISVSLRLLLPAIGAQGAAKRVGRF